MYDEAVRFAKGAGGIAKVTEGEEQLCCGVTPSRGIPLRGH